MEQIIHKWLFMVCFFWGGEGGKSVDKSSILNCLSKATSNVSELSYFLPYLAYFHFHTKTFRTERLIRNITVNFVICMSLV